MTLAPIIAAALTTPVSVPYILQVGEESILYRTDGSGVPVGSITVERSGSGDPAAMRFDHQDPAAAFALPAHGPVRFYNTGTDSTEFSGFLMGRPSRPAFAGEGRITSLVATDASLVLDTTLVLPCSYPAGLSDRDIIQGLVGTTVGVGGIIASSDYITNTNNNMPAMTFELQTLRSALDQVATAAAGDGNGERTLYVRPDWKIRYFRVTIGSAPFVISDNPTGGQKAPEDFAFDDDDSRIRTAVYVVGANAAGSGWVLAPNAAINKYGWRAEPLEVPDSDTVAKRDAYGLGYLASRSQPIRRGSFNITGTTGWDADQQVTITSSAYGLSSEVFLIKHVRMVPLSGAPTWRHEIEFGARKPRWINSIDRFGRFLRR